MKKITLLTAVLFVALLSNAQITKGSTFIGGSISGGSSEDKGSNQNSENKGNSWSVGVELGRFIADNKAVGLFFNHGQSTQKNKAVFGSTTYSNENKTNGYSAGAFYRQYFPLSSKWYLFGDASLGYTSNTTERKTDEKRTEKTKGWGVGLGITPGISFAAGKRLFIESSFNNLLSLNYQKSKTENFSTNGAVTSSYDSKYFNADANLSGLSNINFGLRWILPGKKK